MFSNPLLLLTSAAVAPAAPSRFGLQAIVVGEDMSPSIEGYTASYAHAGAGYNAMTLTDSTFVTEWCPALNGGLAPCGFDIGTGYVASPGMILDVNSEFIQIPLYQNATSPVDFAAPNGYLTGPKGGDRFMACSGDTLGNPTGFEDDVVLSYVSDEQEILEGCADVRLIGFAQSSER